MKKNKKLFRLLLLAAVVLLLIGTGALNGNEADAPYVDDVYVADVQQPIDAPAADISADAPTDAATPDDADDTASAPDAAAAIDEHGSYDTKDEVALFIHVYGRLPDNYISKAEAEEAGWHGGSVEKYCPGKCIGGSRFGNYEGLLPDAEGRTWTECDINTLGASSRGAERIVFSNDGLIYYTPDHYDSFELLYG